MFTRCGAATALPPISTGAVGSRPEVRCVAAPAAIPSSRQSYAIGIPGPSSRLVLGRMPVIAEQVRAAARRFTDLSGGPASENP